MNQWHAAAVGNAKSGSGTVSDGQNETFQQYVERERDRLDAERQGILQQQRELDTRLDEIDRELQAVDAYEAAKTGRAVAGRGRGQRLSGQRASGRGDRQGRRGSKREELLRVIREGNGLTRGEILERMSLKGNKSGEMSVSNGLTALAKSNQVRRGEGRKYFAA
jgi:hypothetical protein